MLLGFGISDYRSFGSTPQILFPMKQINIIVGPNNSGKSNICRAIKMLSQTFNPELPPPKFANLDKPLASEKKETKFYLPAPLNLEFIASDLRHKIGTANLSLVDETSRKILAIYNAIPLRTDDYAWFGFGTDRAKRVLFPTQEDIQPRSENDQTSQSGLSTNEWAPLWTTLTGHSGGKLRAHIEGTLNKISPANYTAIPNVHIIDAHRQIGVADSDYDGLNGKGLIGRLAQIQNPRFEEIAEKRKFDRIIEFLRVVTCDPTAELIVPHSKDELQVKLHGKLLPIESLGTGIHQVVIFAAAATAVSNEIICIDEPENHLHPRLQRALINYLKKTENQYIITSHSAHLLDTPDASIFQVQLNSDLESVISRIEANSDRYSACFNLGYKASDIVQANCIIWVEGPSDRIYINSWIKSIAPDLLEGSHYSVMFYGGRLLSHLTAEDEEISDFVMLPRLNRNTAIIMDSDKNSDENHINNTKQRVAEEIKSAGGFAWITKGREIENYLDPSELQSTLQHAYPEQSFDLRTIYERAYIPTNNTTFYVDKVRIAKLMTRKPTLDFLDLRPQMEALIKFIRKSNS